MSGVWLIFRALGLLIGCVLCLPLAIVCPALAIHLAMRCHELEYDARELLRRSQS